MGAAADAKPEKVNVVLTVPSQGTKRDDKVKVDRELADQIIANGHGREV